VLIFFKDEDVAKTMQKHILPHNSVQARVAKSLKKSRVVHTVPIGSCRGLGINFGSFVGQDKRQRILTYDPQSL